MAGAGILNLIQIFPYTLGANVGTTITAILASLVTSNINAVIVAFAHLLFNITGIIIWWPFKIVPVRLAERLAALAVRNKIIPFVYILTVFFAIPIIVFVLFK